MDGVAGFEAAAKAVAHKRGKISAVFGALRGATAKELAVETGVASRVAGDHGCIEIGDPFPDETMEILNAKKVWRVRSDDRCFFWSWG